MISSIIVAITFSIASFFGALAYLIWRIEVLPKNGKNLKNKEYRIKKVLYDDGNTFYYIQWKWKLFWYTWREMIGCDTWAYIRYKTEEEAKKELFKIVAEDKPKPNPKPILITYPLKITNN